MRDGETQVRALNTLAAHRLSDPVTLEALARLFPTRRDAPACRSAIAGVLIRANYHVLAALRAPADAHAAPAALDRRQPRSTC